MGRIMVHAQVGAVRAQPGSCGRTVSEEEGRPMAHQRCTLCRNPIRSLAVSRSDEDGEAWFHTDCWTDVRLSEQRDYEELVRAVGIDALIAPYVWPTPLPAGSRRPVVTLVDQRRATS
jgi:hypothetical protein